MFHVFHNYLKANKSTNNNRYTLYLVILSVNNVTWWWKSVLKYLFNTGNLTQNAIKQIVRMLKHKITKYLIKTSKFDK